MVCNPVAPHAITAYADEVSLRDIRTRRVLRTGFPFPCGAVVWCYYTRPVGALPRPRHLSNFVQFQAGCGVDCFFLQPVARVLIDAQQHGRVRMAHDLRHGLHVRPVF